MPNTVKTFLLGLIAAFMGAGTFTGLGAAFIRFGTLTDLDFFFVLREGLAVFSFSESLDSDESDRTRGILLLHIVFCGCCIELGFGAVLFVAEGETLTRISLLMGGALPLLAVVGVFDGVV